jgi:outer membrane protein assembly factor BamD (BamD/ComL family)
VLESARIMKRRKCEVNTRTLRAKLFFIIMPTVLVVMTTSSCDGHERRAERLWRQAIACVEKGDTQGGVDHLQKLIDTFPDSRIAEKARAQIIVYRGLASAVENYPMRRARELMVQISRAIESFRREKRRAPATLGDLVPAKLASVPNDPWDRPFLYESTARGYRLRCPGVEGAPQGSAAAAGLLVVDGEFRAVSQ